EDTYWRELGESDLDATQKKIVVMSILMHSTNRKSNSLQSLIGIFLQSAHTPQKVIETLARMGISVSIDAIHVAIRSLSTESLQAVKALGCTLLASYAYDNFDVDLKSTNQTVEKSNESLKHLTSGLVFPLMHGVTQDDLRCSRKLWESSPLNPHASTTTAPKNWENLLSLHCGSDKPDEAGLGQRDRFNSWKFLSDLIHFGPPYFSQFKGRLCASEPKAIEAIPVIKTPILAARAMDLTNSTVTGNIQSVVELLRQGGIENPSHPNESNSEIPDASEYIILFHGDLGTGERL
ncbi:hypothetical protein L210DRAFT_3341799, partial [Boletus edulis BED1]